MHITMNLEDGFLPDEYEVPILRIAMAGAAVVRFLSR